MLNLSETKILIETAMGRQPLDVAIRNTRLVNVITGTIQDACIGIKNGIIVSLNATKLDAIDEIDARGQFAIPSFIDTHVHIDSTLLTPEALSELITPRGTTALFADPMESLNVAGINGLMALLQSKEKLPYHLLIEVSSRVPTAPGLETTGGELNLDDVKQILEWENCISLGELDPSKVLGLRDDYLLKVIAAHNLRKIANGHAAGLNRYELEAYFCGGLFDDHECVDYSEALERLMLGIPVMIREGSTERNLESIIRGVLDDGLDTSNLMFCTDDKHPDDIIDEGHIDYMVNQAIKFGLPPIKAIQMATVNAASHFHLEDQLGSLGIRRWADFLLCEDLNYIIPNQVFFKGMLVAENGQLIEMPKIEKYPDWFYHTVIVKKGRHSDDFHLTSSNNRETVNVVNIYGDQIINQKGKAELDVLNENVVSDPNQDVLKLAVVERYGKNGNIGISFVKGFGLKKGALASSVAHDHHNIIIVGVDEESMATCVREIESLNGGLVVANGDNVLGALPLPLGGLMSESPSKDVINILGEITQKARDLGCELPAPFMTLSFISLPTVPELGITDLGLVDVRSNKIISTII